ncbi:MAG: very short patch repair endonuclease [Stellaceae bacterium]
MDTVTPRRRSEIMAAIRSKDTAPELTVRRYLHAAGLRYRLHQHGLPGRPDLVFSGRRLCVFIHGCFWHGCPHYRHGMRDVKSNTAYWLPKLARTRARDADNQQRLLVLGWTTLTIWECHAADPAELVALARSIRAVPPIKRSSAPARARLVSAAAPSRRAARRLS